mmetsp:Transcript_42105/g.63558  ORF Transcript_42105/g.63558 Transcript_42105/m.63558 type:complete len:451 (+) Transcript_42105:76-1428(+)
MIFRHSRMCTVGLCLLLSASSNGDATADFQKTLSDLPSCPLGDALPVQHHDGVCNRAYVNSPEVRRLRKKPLHLHMVTGAEAVSRLPEEKTWICPDDDGAAEEESSGALHGHLATWIVKNESSGPVSLAWVDYNRGGLEVSAKNGKISPPHIDPDAILRPGEWTSLNVFQGHVFHVRELREVGGSVFPGRILLRHRPGLIPVGDGLGDMHCPASALADPDPNETKTPETNFLRTPENDNNLCNVLYRGFLNKAGCPLDIYFAGTQPADGGTSQQRMEKKANYTSSYSTVEPSIACAEIFKMHLGINRTPNNYLDDWSSPIKFEGSYLNHRFVARMRHDPSIVVDEIVMELDTARDCPVRSSVKASAATMERVAQNIEVTVDEKPSPMSIVVPADANGYYHNSTDLYMQIGAAGNITAIAASEECGDCDVMCMKVVLPEGYSSKMVAMTQS